VESVREMSKCWKLVNWTVNTLTLMDRTHLVMVVYSTSVVVIDCSIEGAVQV